MLQLFVGVVCVCVCVLPGGGEKAEGGAKKGRKSRKYETGRPRRQETAILSEDESVRETRGVSSLPGTRGSPYSISGEASGDWSPLDQSAADFPPQRFSYASGYAISLVTDIPAGLSAQTRL